MMIITVFKGGIVKDRVSLIRVEEEEKKRGRSLLHNRSSPSYCFES